LKTIPGGQNMPFQIKSEMLIKNSNISMSLCRILIAISFHLLIIWQGWAKSNHVVDFEQLIKKQQEK
jgi:hypothetical protein